MKSKTEEMIQIDLEMSNFDGCIDEGLEEALKKEPGRVCGAHPAWNHYGQVYYKNGLFFEEVMVYGSLRSVESAPTLKELMNKVNDQYGWD